MSGITARTRANVTRANVNHPLFVLTTMAEALKVEGRKAVVAKDYNLAIDLFSKALDLDQHNFVLWSNRSSDKAGKRNWDDVLVDADQVCPMSQSDTPYAIDP